MGRWTQRAILAAGLLSLFAMAQTGTGSLSGKVRAGKRPAAGINLTVINQQTEEQFSTQVDTEGKYLFRSLPAGVYRIRVVLPGFGKIERTDITVGAGQQVHINIDLPAISQAKPPTAMEPAPPPAPPVPPPPPPPSPVPAAEPKEPAGPRLTGRSLLVAEQDEASGYGLYSYVLFASGPTDATRERYESTFRAYLQMLADTRELEAAKVARERLNVTYLPVKQQPGEKTPDAAWALQNYHWARAQVLLSRFQGKVRGPGPYIVSALKPLSGFPADHYLFQDLSAVPPSLIAAWFQEFLTQAGQDRFWEPPAVMQMTLKLRTNIEVAALALPNVESGGKSWKSLLATWITGK